MSIDHGCGFQREAFGMGLIVLLLSSCSTLPAPQVKRYEFPREGVFLAEPDRPYEVMGLVRSKAKWPTLLLPDADEQGLCRNYYNKASADLLKRAREAGADAVASIKSVVFLVTGKRVEYTTAECSDDGENGEILMEGVAVRFKKLPIPAPSPSSPSSHPGSTPVSH